MLIKGKKLIPIKSCPFCGQEVILDRFYTDDDITCVRCSCGAIISFQNAEDQESFIRRWNFRPERPIISFVNVSSTFH